MLGLNLFLDRHGWEQLSNKKDPMRWVRDAWVFSRGNDLPFPEHFKLQAFAELYG